MVSKIVKMFIRQDKLKKYPALSKIGNKIRTKKVLRIQGNLSILYKIYSSINYN